MKWLGLILYFIAVTAIGCERHNTSELYGNYTFRDVKDRLPRQIVACLLFGTPDCVDYFLESDSFLKERFATIRASSEWTAENTDDFVKRKRRQLLKRQRDMQEMVALLGIDKGAISVKGPLNWGDDDMSSLPAWAGSAVYKARIGSFVIPFELDDPFVSSQGFYFEDVGFYKIRAANPIGEFLADTIGESLLDLWCFFEKKNGGRSVKCLYREWQM